MKKEPHPTKDDVVLDHPENKSNVRIKDDGTIQMFAEGGTGLKINPRTETISLFAGNIAMQGDQINFHTEDRGLIWNYTPFNRALANPTRELMTTFIGGTELFKNTLTTPGAYISSMPGTPAQPGTIQIVNSIDMKGMRAYRGIEYVNMMKRVAEGMSTITEDVGEAMGDVK